MRIAVITVFSSLFIWGCASRKGKTVESSYELSISFQKDLNECPVAFSNGSDSTKVSIVSAQEVATVTILGAMSDLEGVLSGAFIDTSNSTKHNEFLDQAQKLIEEEIMVESTGCEIAERYSPIILTFRRVEGKK